MSKYCANCGHELPDEARFCGFCGTVQPMADTRPANNQIKSTSQTQQGGNDGTPWAMPTDLDGGGAQQGNGNPGQPGPGQIKWEPKPTKMPPVLQNLNMGLIAKIGIAVAAVVVVIAIVAVVFLGDKSATDNAMIWVEDGSYMYSRDIASDDDPIEITTFRSDYDDGSGYAVITADGKYAYLVNRISSSGYGSLYRVELDKLSDNTSKNEDYIEKLDSDVYRYESGYFLLDNGTLLYLRGDDRSSAQLRYYDGSEVQTLSSGVYGYSGIYNYGGNSYGVTVTEDQKTVIYTKEDDDYTYSIYCQTIGDADSEYRVAAGTEGYVLYDATHILYSKSDYVDDVYTTAWYVGGMDEESVKLSGNVAGYSYAAFGEDGLFYYTVRGTSSAATLADYVTNSHAEEDATATAPDESDYEKTVTKTDSWTGETNTTTETDWDAYWEAYDEYSEGVVVRQELIALLEEEETTITSYELYCYSAASGESTLISSECGTSYPTVSAIEGSSVAVYQKSVLPEETLSIDAVLSVFVDWEYDYYGYEDTYSNYTSDYELYGIDFDDYYNDYDLVIAYINAFLSSGGENNGYYYSVSGGAEQLLNTADIDMEGVSWLSVQLFDSGKQVAVRLSGSGYDDEDIYVAPVSGGVIGALTATQAYESDSMASYQGELFYWVYTSGNYDNVELYRYEDDDWELICEGVEMANFYEDGTTILLTDYTSYGYTMIIINASGEKQTLSDVDDYLVLSNGNIVLRSNDSLKLYDGTETTTIAYDVDYNSYFPMNEKEDGDTLEIWW
ncbi:MAG: zinc ribbon domain-containing protein [Clostridiales bacterium]|nr:zinc ribbon domain-containing protein [Clostridiales bacterium]